MALRRFLRAAALVLLGAVAAMPATAASTISGSASYRERIALPPQAVFEATLEDISRADAPATVLGRTRMASPGQPPIRFQIEYDPAAIETRHRYVLRARITLDGQLMFTTDTLQAVQLGGDTPAVDLLLVRARSAAPQPAASAASAVPGPARRLHGLYTYRADAGSFSDCASGRRLPVAQAGDNAALEAAYGRARSEPGAPVLAAVDARVEMRLPMEGRPPQPTLVVERFVEILPGADCPPRAASPLENTYWRLVDLQGRPVQLAEKQRELHLILQPAQRRVAGSGGCNRLMGSYQLDGDNLRFGQVAGTMMACPADVMVREREFIALLAQATRWRIVDGRLELVDGQGSLLARFESRLMR